MPSTVLTASSMRCETCGLDLLGRGARAACVRTMTVGRSTAGKRSTPRLEVAGRADHDQRQDEHRREDRPADADLGELLHRSGGVSAIDRLAGREVAGLDDHDRSPAGEARRAISTRSPARRPVAHALLDRLAVLDARAPCRCRRR